MTSVTPQVEHMQQETAAVKKQMQKIKEQFLQQKVLVELSSHEAWWWAREEIPQKPGEPHLLPDSKILSEVRVQFQAW